MEINEILQNQKNSLNNKVEKVPNKMIKILSNFKTQIKRKRNRLNLMLILIWIQCINLARNSKSKMALKN